MSDQRGTEPFLFRFSTVQSGGLIFCLIREEPSIFDLGFQLCSRVGGFFCLIREEPSIFYFKCSTVQ